MSDIAETDMGGQRAVQASTAEIRSLYEANGQYVDDQIGRMVGELRRRGQWEETVLIVTADHGELLGDRPIPDDFPWGHANYLTDYVTRVPLVLAGGGLPEETVDGVASGTDIGPSITSMVGIETPEAWQGHPLDSEAYHDREYVYSVTGRGFRQDATEGTKIPRDTLHASLRTAEHALLWWSRSHGPEWYERSAAHTDRRAHETAVDEEEVPEADRFLRTLTDRFEPTAAAFAGGEDDRSEVDLDEETVERLQQLGYVE